MREYIKGKELMTFKNPKRAHSARTKSLAHLEEDDKIDLQGPSLHSCPRIDESHFKAADRNAGESSKTAS